MKDLILNAALAIVGLLMALLMVVAITVSPSKASGNWWDSEFHHPKPKVKPRHAPRRASEARRRAKPSRPVLYQPEIANRPGPPENRFKCMPGFRTVGDQALTVGGAKENAEKAWQQQVRFSYGERYSDIGNATDKTFECVRSSIGSVAGQIFLRCEMYSKPCMGPQAGASD